MPLWFCQITEQVRVSNKHQRGDVWAANLFQQRIHSENEDEMQDQFGKNVKEEEKDFTGIWSENLMPFKYLSLHLHCFFEGKYGLFLVHL